MNKIYYLSTCSTCKKILKSNDFPGDCDFQDIKTNKISKNQLNALIQSAGNIQKLFSKKARKYSSMKLADKNLTGADYEKLILEEYTFLKRPVILLDDEIFIGSSKSELKRLSDHLEKH